MEKIGFIGLGAMGGPMAANLLKAGFALTVYDVRPEAVAVLADKGAARGNSIASVAANSDIVITMLPSSPQVEEVVMSSGGLLESMSTGSVLVDMSTISPITSRKVAGLLKERGIDFLDAPVTKGVGAAVSGDLTIIVGGEGPVLERCQPALRAMGTTIHHVGGIGAGEVVKVVNNFVLATTVMALAEGFVAGVKAGADPDAIARVLSDGSGDSYALRSHMMQFALPGKLDSRFPTNYMLKDVGLFISMAKEYQVPSAMAPQTAYLLEIARAVGKGGIYFPVVMDILAEMIGVEVRSSSSQ